MAKQQNGIIDVYRGRVGTVIGYQWRGRWCLRARPVRVHNPRTPEQQAVRGRFATLSRLAARMLPTLRRGMHHMALQNGVTECNLFISLNQGAVGDGEVDYSRVAVAYGPVAPVAFGSAAVDGGIVSVAFEKNPQHRAASATDEVRLFAYCPALDSGLLSGGAPRRERRVAMVLPDEWAGLEVHLYGFVEDVAGRASESEYIGTVAWSGAAAPGLDEAPAACNDAAAAPAGAAANKKPLALQQGASISTQSVVGAYSALGASATG